MDVISGSAGVHAGFLINPVVVAVKEQSQFFSELDLEMLLRYVEYPNQYDAVKAFQEATRCRKD